MHSKIHAGKLKEPDYRWLDFRMSTVYIYILMLGHRVAKEI